MSDVTLRVNMTTLTIHIKRTKYIQVTFVLSVTVIFADVSDLVTLVTFVMLYIRCMIVVCYECVL